MPINCSCNQPRLHVLYGTYDLLEKLHRWSSVRVLMLQIFNNQANWKFGFSFSSRSKNLSSSLTDGILLFNELADRFELESRALIDSWITDTVKLKLVHSSWKKPFQACKQQGTKNIHKILPFLKKSESSFYMVLKQVFVWAHTMLDSSVKLVVHWAQDREKKPDSWPFYPVGGKSPHSYMLARW